MSDDDLKTIETALRSFKRGVTVSLGKWAERERQGGAALTAPSARRHTGCVRLAAQGAADWLHTHLWAFVYCFRHERFLAASNDNPNSFYVLDPTETAE